LKGETSRKAQDGLEVVELSEMADWAATVDDLEVPEGVHLLLKSRN
jgi:hypothetical protein